MSDHDQVPTVGTHRGVGLHDQQSPERLAVVRRAIDEVFDVTDFRKLLEIARIPRWPPEARGLAAAKLEAMYQIAADKREIRPTIDLDFVRACVAGLNSQKWRDPIHYGSLLDHGRNSGTEAAVRRETPLQRE